MAKRGNYLDNQELLVEAIQANDAFRKWKDDNNASRGFMKLIATGELPPLPKISENLSKMLWQMCKGIINSSHFYSYTPDWKDELEGEISIIIMTIANKFDHNKEEYKNLSIEEKGVGCFNYYSKCIFLSYYKVIERLHKQKVVNDKLTKKGLEGSGNFMEEEDYYPSPEEMMIIKEKIEALGGDLNEIEEIESEMTPEQNQARNLDDEATTRYKNNVEWLGRIKDDIAVIIGDQEKIEKKSEVSDDEVMEYNNIIQEIMEIINPIDQTMIQPPTMRDNKKGSSFKNDKRKACQMCGCDLKGKDLGNVCSKCEARVMKNAMPPKTKECKMCGEMFEYKSSMKQHCNKCVVKARKVVNDEWRAKQPIVKVKIAKPCQECGKDIKNPNTNQKFCNKCREIKGLNNLYKRPCMQKAPVTAERNCKRCGKEFEGIKRQYCDDCAAILRNETHTKARLKREKKKREVMGIDENVKCQGCGVDLGNAHRLKKWCENCRKELAAKNEQDKRDKIKEAKGNLICVDCGMEMPRQKHGQNKKRCAECKRKFLKEYMRNYEKMKINPRISETEIDDNCEMDDLNKLFDEVVGKERHQ